MIMITNLIMIMMIIIIIMMITLHAMVEKVAHSYNIHSVCSPVCTQIQFHIIVIIIIIIITIIIIIILIITIIIIMIVIITIRWGWWPALLMWGLGLRCGGLARIGGTSRRGA